MRRWQWQRQEIIPEAELELPLHRPRAPSHEAQI